MRLCNQVLLKAASALEHWASLERVYVLFHFLFHIICSSKCGHRNSVVCGHKNEVCGHKNEVCGHRNSETKFTFLKDFEVFGHKMFLERNEVYISVIKCIKYNLQIQYIYHASVFLDVNFFATMVFCFSPFILVG